MAATVSSKKLVIGGVVFAVLFAAIVGVWIRESYLELRREGLRPQIVRAVEDSDAARVEELLNQGADPNTRYVTGDAKVRPRSFWLRIIDHPRGRHGTDSDELTILTIAAWQGDQRMVHALLHAGADPNLAGIHHYTSLYFSHSGTPLHYAVRLGRGSIVEELLLNGADPNLAESDGTTPLHVATESSAEFRSAESDPTNPGPGSVMVMTIGWGRANEMLRSRPRISGDQALREITSDIERGFSALIAAGADPNRRDSRGWTPIDIARKAKWTEGLGKLSQITKLQ